MEMFLDIDSNFIHDAKFQAIGCEGAFICGSAVTELIKGKTVPQAEGIEKEQVIEYLGEFPEEKHGCACLGIRTLKKNARRIQKTSINKGETMKIAISAQGKDMNAAVDPRLGRAQQFLIVDTESMAYEALENPNIGASGGAGIQTAQLLASKEVQAVITGNCGPNAFTTLHAAGVQVYIGASGTVQQALDQHKDDQLQLANQPNVGGHFGDTRPDRGQG